MAGSTRSNGTLAIRRAGDETGVHWVTPELVGEVGFTEWTRDQKLRHPRFLGLRRDKAAEDVVREAPDELASTKTVTVGGHAIELSNLDKVLFPERPHQGRPGRLLPPHRRVGCRTCATGR